MFTIYDGGCFKGATFTDDSGKKYNFAICWGKIVKEPKVQMFNKKKTSFTMKWHTKQYMMVVMWGDSEAADVASTLEVGDIVLCCGTITTSRYMVKKGEFAGQEKEWYDLNPQIIIPMSSITFVLQMFGTAGIQKMIADGVNNTEADAMESADDYIEDAEVREVPDGFEFSL